MKPITILLVDDHKVVREGLRGMLDLEDDLAVVGAAKNGRQGVSMAAALLPDVILMDIAMPGINGLAAPRPGLQTHPGPKIIMLTAHNDEAYATSATAAGASGFLLKQTSSHNVCRAVREVCNGKTFFGKPAARAIARRNRQSCEPAGGGNHTRLTPRETEVLRWIAAGKADTETAVDLEIGLKTVAKHRSALMAKLGIHDTASLTRYAVSSGIVESGVP